MKLQKLLLLAGLLLASGLQAMQPLAPGLVSTDYSDDSGSESDVEAPVYADKPIVLPAKKELTPSETPRTPVTTLPVTVIQPQQPVVAKPSPFKPQQTVGIVGALLGQRIQHSEFEVAIANSTNDTYKVSYNNQIITLQPNDVKTIDLPNLVKTTGPTIVRSRTTAGTTTTSTTSRSIETQTITLERASDKQQFSLNIGRGSNDKKQIVAAIGLSQGKQVIKTANAIFNPPGLGQTVYYVMQINLLGNDLKETTIEITPTLAQ